MLSGKCVLEKFVLEKLKVPIEGHFDPRCCDQSATAIL